MKKINSLVILMGMSLGLYAQPFSLQEAIEAARTNNLSMKSAAYSIEQQKQLRRASFNLPKTQVTFMQGQYNSYVSNDNNVTLVQTIPFTALGSEAALNRSLELLSRIKKDVTENDLLYQVQQTYYQLSHLYAQQKLLARQDSIFRNMARSSAVRYQAGETYLLEKTSAETQSLETQNLLREVEADILVYRTELEILTNRPLDNRKIDESVEMEFPAMVDSLEVQSNPSLQFLRQQVDVAGKQKKFERGTLGPDLTIGFFSQTLIGFQNVNGQEQYFGKDKRFTGFEVGVSLPVWFLPYTARIKATEYKMQSVQLDYEYRQKQLNGEVRRALQQVRKNKNSLDYYRTSALPNAELILQKADASFKNGEIGFAEYMLSLRSATGMHENHLKTLNNYNQSIIYLNYLLGNQLQSNEKN